MVEKVSAKRHMEVYVNSEILGKYRICLFKGDDCVECYLLQPGYPMTYMFGLDIDMPYKRVVEICVNNVLNHWQID